jgi:hypothetical protein
MRIKESGQEMRAKKRGGEAAPLKMRQDQT